MRLDVSTESWPIAGTFTISRGSKTAADVVVATVSDGQFSGRGECVPYPRYGESIAGALETLDALKDAVGKGLTRDMLMADTPPGAARNALDCALLDFEAKASRRPAHEILGLPEPAAITTAFTLSLGEPAAMADAARSASTRPLLKLKLGPDGALARVRAVHDAAPAAALILDANEAWSVETLNSLTPQLAALGVVLIEQPLPAGADDALAEVRSPIPLCADESLHGIESLRHLCSGYQYLNIKLDKTGGLTEAVLVAREAISRGLGIMVGCMVSTSLGMAPAFALTPLARFVDLDGPLLLARDREPAIRYDGSIMQPPPRALWG